MRAIYASKLHGVVVNMLRKVKFTKEQASKANKNYYSQSESTLRNCFPVLRIDLRS